MVAEDDEVFFGVELLVGACGDVAHGHGDGAGKAGERKFRRLADIDEAGFLFAEKSRRAGWGNLVIEHDSSVAGGVRAVVRAGKAKQTCRIPEARPCSCRAPQGAASGEGAGQGTVSLVLL